jgi:23S rRNA (uridine2552-2'-O)-methyltransferase
LILPKAWLRARRRDYFYRKAKEEQLRSRAAYKLLEVVDRYGLIRRGDVVVDLGAAPGGWMQVALDVVGSRGFVLGVDVKVIEPFEGKNVRTVVADISDVGAVDLVCGLLPRLADVVVSDVSPNVSGVWEVDHARQVDLARRSLVIAGAVLRRGGGFFVKVFQGDLLDEFVLELRDAFGFVRFVKPRASRRGSSELFVLCLDKK